MHPLLAAWRGYTPCAPYLLDSDRAALDRPGLFFRAQDWAAYVSDPNFGAPKTSELNVDLLPLPYVGDVEGALVYLLMLNPGLAPSDYYGEHQVPAYRDALLQNLRQEPGRQFIFLDPQFSWHGGFVYWHTKLGKLIESLASQLACSYGQARSIMQRKVAALELVPYHSASFGLPGSMLDQLKSADLARSFVHDVVVPKAIAGKCLVVVTRAAKQWRLPEHENIVTYSGSEARGAHLSRKSRGGAAILRFLSKTSRGDV